MQKNWGSWEIQNSIKNNYDMAIKCYREALDIYAKGEGQGSVDHANTLSNLGLAYEVIDSLYQSLEAF